MSSALVAEGVSRGLWIQVSMTQAAALCALAVSLRKRVTRLSISATRNTQRSVTTAAHSENAARDRGTSDAPARELDRVRWSCLRHGRSNLAEPRASA